MLQYHFQFWYCLTESFWSISTQLTLWYGYKEDDVPTMHQGWYLQDRKGTITVIAQGSRETLFEISYALVVTPTQ